MFRRTSAQASKLLNYHLYKIIIFNLGSGATNIDTTIIQPKSVRCEFLRWSAASQRISTGHIGLKPDSLFHIRSTSYFIQQQPHPLSSSSTSKSQLPAAECSFGRCHPKILLSVPPTNLCAFFISGYCRSGRVVGNPKLHQQYMMCHISLAKWYLKGLFCFLFDNFWSCLLSRDYGTMWLSGTDDAIIRTHDIMVLRGIAW